MSLNLDLINLIYFSQISFYKNVISASQLV